MLEQRQRFLPEPSPLCLLRAHDLLELDLPEPDLTPYRSPADEATQPPSGENNEPRTEQR
jgi:hypothetical protein